MPTPRTVAVFLAWGAPVAEVLWSLWNCQFLWPSF